MNLICTISAVFVAVFVASTINFVDGKPQSYYYDRCGQRCIRITNKVFNCTRIRKEFTSMSLAERKFYIDTVFTASTDPKYKAAYDKLITEHEVLFDAGIHEAADFLTWHRYYLLKYENLMRTINCRFTVSYWDWSLVSGNPWKTGPLSLWFAGPSGMGGNGSLPDHCVENGTFSEGNWILPPSADNGCLKRDFRGNTPSPVAVELLLRIPASKFKSFELNLRTVLHDNVHCEINGTMCIEIASSAPEFFLHHAMVDKIWADWQSLSEDHMNAYFSEQTDKIIYTPYYHHEFIDLTNQPGGVKVEYDEPRNHTVVYGFLRGLKKGDLKKIPRLEFTPLSKKAISLFGLSGKVLRKVRRFEKEVQPSPKLRLTKMPPGSTDLEISIGFQLKKPK